MGRRRSFHENRRAFRHIDHIGIRYPIRRRDNDFVPGADRRHNRVEEDLFAAGTNGDLAGFVGQSVFAREFCDNRLLQRGRAVNRSIFGLMPMVGEALTLARRWAMKDADMGVSLQVKKTSNSGVP